MIEDFEGPELPPRRRTAMRIVSVALAAAAFVGYAAASSPTLHGPFATPDPSAAAASATPSPRFTPGARTSFDPAGGPFPLVIAGPGCVVPGASPPTTEQIVFVGGQSVTLLRVDRSLPTCPPGFGTTWGQPPSAIPLERISR